MLFHREVVDGVHGDDAAESIFFEGEICHICNDAEGVVAEAFFCFLEGGDRNISADSVVVVLGVSLIFGVLDGA